MNSIELEDRSVGVEQGSVDDGRVDCRRVEDCRVELRS